MKNFFNKMGIWTLAAAVVIVLTLSILSATGTGLLDNIAGTIASPFRSAGAAIGNWVGSISDKFDDVDTLQKENEELKKRIAELEEANRQAQTDSQENERLRNLLNLRQQRRDFTFESAKVTQYENSNWASTLTLNRGTSSGVAVNNCVVDEYGALVGVVTEVGLNWCTVATVLDTQAQFGATVFRTGEAAVAMGDLSLMSSGKVKLNYLSGTNPPVGGDLVLTSGLGGYFPSGLVIGSVEDVRTDDSGLTQYAVVQPNVRPESLVQVFVITAFDIVD